MVSIFDRSEVEVLYVLHQWNFLLFGLQLRSAITFKGVGQILPISFRRLPFQTTRRVFQQKETAESIPHKKIDLSRNSFFAEDSDIAVPNWVLKFSASTPAFAQNTAA